MDRDKPFIRYKINDWIRDFTSLGNPLILLLVPFAVLGPCQAFYNLLIVLTVNELLCSAIKFFFHKPRPDGQKYKTILEKIDAGSFPSIHASRITIVYTTLIQATNSLALKLCFLLVILIVLYSRIALKRHFFIDILGGLSIGMLLYFLFHQFIFI